MNDNEVNLVGTSYKGIPYEERLKPEFQVHGRFDPNLWHNARNEKDQKMAVAEAETLLSGPPTDACRHETLSKDNVDGRTSSGSMTL